MTADETTFQNGNIFEESAEEVLDEAPCGFLSTLPDGTILKVNRTFATWTGYDQSWFLDGRRFQDLLTVPGRIFYETHFSPLLRMQGFVNEINCQVVRKDLPPLQVLVNSSLKSDLSGRPLVVRTTVFDATDRTKYESELRRARREAEQLAAIVNSSADAIISMEEDGTVLTWNPGAEKLFGWTSAQALGKTLQKLNMEIENGIEFSAKLDVIRRDRSVQFDSVMRRNDGSIINVSAHLSTIGNSEGMVTAISAIYRDITDRKRDEEHKVLLMNELNHRVKNTLATIQSMVSQTLRSSPSLGEAKIRFEARLISLSKAHDVLTREKWESAPLADIVDQAILPYQGVNQDKFIVAGPDIRISAQMALAFAMTLHELCTNAVKYGALSGEEGQVAIAWSVSGSMLTFRWSETGGPAVMRPSSAGFGTKLIERSLSSDLGGHVKITFAKTGVTCKITGSLGNPRSLRT